MRIFLAGEWAINIKLCYNDMHIQKAIYNVFRLYTFSLYHFNLSYNHFIWSWPSSLRVIKAINLAALDSIIFWIDLGLSWSVGYENIRNQYSFSFTYVRALGHIDTYTPYHPSKPTQTVSNGSFIDPYYQFINERLSYYLHVHIMCLT